MIESGLSGQGSWLWMDRGARAGGVTDTWLLCEVRAVRLRGRARPRFVWAGGVQSRVRVSRKTSISDAVHQPALRCAELCCAVMEEGKFLFARLCGAKQPQEDPSYLGYLGRLAVGQESWHSMHMLLLPSVPQ